MVKTEQLVDTITRAIQEKKGEDIAIIDLRKTDGAIGRHAAHHDAVKKPETGSGLQDAGRSFSRCARQS